MVEKSRVGKFMVEKSGIEMSFYQCQDHHVNPPQLLSLSKTRLRAGDLGHDIFHLDFDDLIWLTLQHSLKICNCFLMAGHAVGLWRLRTFRLWIFLPL